MGDQNYGGPTQPGGWTPVPGQGEPPASPTYTAGSAQYPPPPPGYNAAGGYPPPPPGYNAAGGYPPPPPGQIPSGQPGYGAAPVAGDGLSPNIAALLCYLLFIPAIVFLVMDPYKRSPFIRFHCWQVLVLACTAVVFSFACIPIAIIFGLLHLGFLILFVEFAFSLALGVCAIIALIKAVNGAMWRIPVLGDLAAKMAASNAPLA